LTQILYMYELKVRSKESRRYGEGRQGANIASKIWQNIIAGRIWQNIIAGRIWQNIIAGRIWQNIIASRIW